jgi:hypothetical protein
MYPRVLLRLLFESIAPRGEQVVEEENCLDGITLLIAILGLRMHPELVGGLVRIAAMGLGEVLRKARLAAVSTIHSQLFPPSQSIPFAANSHQKLFHPVSRYATLLLDPFNTISASSTGQPSLIFDRPSLSVCHRDVCLREYVFRVAKSAGLIFVPLDNQDIGRRPRNLQAYKR